MRQRRQRIQGMIGRQRRHGWTFGVLFGGGGHEIKETSRRNVRVVRLGFDRDDVIDRFDVANGSGCPKNRAPCHRPSPAFSITLSRAFLRFA